MNFLSIIPSALKIIGGILGLDSVSEAGKTLEGAQIPPEKQVELQAALLKHEEAMKQLSIDEMKVAITESVAMIQSPDKYTSRARPTGVYAATFITAILAIGMLFEIKLDTGAVATLLVPLWGSAAYYTHARSNEKIAATNGNGH